MHGYAVDLLTKMLKIYSPTGQEEHLASFLVNEMQKLGFHSYRDNAGNAVGEYESREPTFLLCGHMDTVPGRLPVKLQDGKLYGRGAVDAKAPLAAMIVAASLLVQEKVPCNLIVVGAVEEEGTGRGVKHLIEREVKADYAVFGEPSGVENITIAYKGSLHLRLECNTVTGHSSAPWLFKNAIEEAFKIFKLIQGLHFQEENPESRFYSLSSALIKIEGGDEFSTIPSKCVASINMRIPPNLSTNSVLKGVKKILQEYSSKAVDASIKLTVLDSCPPYEADKNSLLVRSLAYGIRRRRKKAAVLVRRTGSGDMNLYGSVNKIPAVTYGPGDSHLDHTPKEYVRVEDYIDSIQILYEGLKKLIDLHLTAKKLS